MAVSATMAKKKKRKKTPEERAAERAYREDLDRRLRAKTEELRARSQAKGTAEGG